MGTAQDDGVDVGTILHQQVDILLDEVIGAVAATLTVLDQRHPHGACVAMNLITRVHALNLDVVTAAGDSARRAKHADVPRVRQFAHFLDRGAHDAQHAAVGR